MKRREFVVSQTYLHYNRKAVIEVVNRQLDCDFTHAIIITDGLICTLKEAIARIGMSEYNTGNKTLMKEFIEEANNSRSADDAISLYRNIFEKKELKRILFLFDNIETNYVTVTNDNAKLFKDGYITTPIELFEDFIN